LCPIFLDDIMPVTKRTSFGSTSCGDSASLLDRLILILCDV
jgi:hypothetical protein